MSEKKYTVVFEVFGKRLRVKIPAKNMQEATEKLHKYIKLNTDIESIIQDENKEEQNSVNGEFTSLFEEVFGETGLFETGLFDKVFGKKKSTK